MENYYEWTKIEYPNPRLPNLGERVLCAFDENISNTEMGALVDVHRNARTNFTSLTWFTDCQGRTYDEVIAWMRIKPYGE